MEWGGKKGRVVREDISEERVDEERRGEGTNHGSIACSG